MFSSIRKRLLLSLLLTISFISSISLFLIYKDTRYEVQELFDAQLAQSARVIQAQALYAIDKIDVNEIQQIINTQSLIMQSSNNHDEYIEEEEDTPYGHRYERKIAFQIWNDKKVNILHSAAAPTVPLSRKALSPHNRGYHDEVINETLWRVFSLWDLNNKYMIQVGERYDVRDELVTKISRKMIMPSLIALPLMALLIWIAIGKGLKPLIKASREISRRDPGFLQPIELGPLPDEIRPLAESLNKLLYRLAEALEKERQFTDDAAHELRTPLAALKTQAQVALRSVNEQEKDTAIKQIITGVDRATHLVQQMLTFARLNPEKIQLSLHKINIYNEIADIIAQHASHAIKKNINLSLEGDMNLSIMSEQACLTSLIGNLLDNAIKYTPEDGNISIKISSDNDKVMVTIMDSGTGIPESSQKRIFDRFYRVLGTKTSGSGLGLAIVKQSASILHATVSLENIISENEIQGLAATITFNNS